jgi:hypothetical protein
LLAAFTIERYPVGLGDLIAVLASKAFGHRTDISPAIESVISPSTTNLVANIERLKLDVEKILPLHGPGVATRADLYKAAGKAVPANTAGN